MRPAFTFLYDPARRPCLSLTRQGRPLASGRREHLGTHTHSLHFAALAAHATPQSHQRGATARIRRRIFHHARVVFRLTVSRARPGPPPGPRARPPPSSPSPTSRGYPRTARARAHATRSGESLDGVVDGAAAGPARWSKGTIYSVEARHQKKTRGKGRGVCGLRSPGPSRHALPQGPQPDPPLREANEKARQGGKRSVISQVIRSDQTDESACAVVVIAIGRLVVAFPPLHPSHL